jgi:undecaprenyl diphosphate synthase
MKPYELSNFHPGVGSIPIHIGLIPDGTGRWAVRNKISMLDAYNYSLNKISQLTQLFYKEGSEAVSIYLSSIQNMKRPQEITNAFCMAQATFCTNTLPLFVKNHGTRVMVAGNRSVIPKQLHDGLSYIEEFSRENQATRLYLCIAYNPLEEVWQATHCSNTPEDFLQKLWVPEPIDMVIRTSGANLFSNFLPLQTGYARFYVLDELFPDTKEEEYQGIITDFKRLVRKYGD